MFGTRIFIQDPSLELAMSECVCGIGGSSDRHLEMIEFQDQQAKWVRDKLPHEEAILLVAMFMKAKFSIMECAEIDTTHAREKWNEYRKQKPIKNKTQLGLRKIFSD